MPKAEKLFRFLASFILRKFYGTVIIRFECGKVTHVETETCQNWAYQDLPHGVSRSSGRSSSLAAFKGESCQGKESDNVRICPQQEASGMA